MLEKNKLIVGLLLGVLIPVVGYFLLTGLYALLEQAGWVSSSGFRPMFRERTMGIIAIALNAVLLNYFQKKYFFNAVRGIVIAICVFVGLWLYLFGQYVL